MMTKTLFKASVGTDPKIKVTPQKGPPPRLCSITCGETPIHDKAHNSPHQPYTTRSGRVVKPKVIVSM